MKALLLNLRCGQQGNAMVETAAVLPAFIAVIVGGMYLAMLGFTAACMQFAVQAGARCASMGNSNCADDTKIAAYTLAQYRGISTVTPIFTSSSTSACGHSVSGSITVPLYMVIKTINVPLTSTACFP
jgi:Flp pilus assembly protein TadG